MDVQQVGTAIHVVINNPGIYPENSTTNPQQAVVVAASVSAMFYKLQANPNYVDPGAQAQQAQQSQQVGSQLAPVAFKAAPIAGAVTLTPDDNSDAIYTSDPRAFVAAFWE